MATAADKRIDTKFWWWLGHVVDLIHMPIVIVFVVLGAGWFPGSVYVTLVTVLVVLQVALLGCPVIYLTGHLKRLHDPDYQNDWSFTVWLYRNYGRGAGVAVFVFFLAVALLFRWLMF